MKRAIVLSLVLLAGAGHAQDDWSYPVDPYFGILHASEYPGDAFPIDVNFMPKTIATTTLLRMGDPALSWTYWPEPSYYWWDALTGPGILHGAWQSTAIAKDVRECPPEVCVQIYDPNDAGGNIEFIFDSQTENVRIRLARFDSVDEGGFQIGSDWVAGQVEIPKDAFLLEHGEESNTCAVYEYVDDDLPEFCRVYQVVIPPVPDSSVLLYGKCFDGDCSVLKVSSTTDAVTYYPSEATAAEDPEDDSDDTSGTVNSAPTVKVQIADMSATENQAISFSVADSFEDSDGDALTYAETGLPGSLGIDTATGMISGTPSATDAGKTFTVTITASDPSGASVDGSFNISISALAPPLVVSAQPAAVTSAGGGSSGPLLLIILALMSLLRMRRRTEM